MCKNHSNLKHIPTSFPKETLFWKASTGLTDR